MAKEPTDAKLATDPSTVTPEVEPQAKDDKEVTADSSNAAAGNDKQEPKTLDEVAEGLVKEAAEASSTTPAETGEKESVVEKEAATTPKDEKVEELPPFHQHPRWQEKLAEVKTLKEELEQVKPLAQQVDGLKKYCEANNVNEQQFKDALEIAALINNNPAEAYKRLQPIVGALSQITEGAVPDDLKDEVASGALDVERAKEIGRLRAQEKVRAQRGELTAKQQQEQAVNQVVASLETWDRQKRGADPDFKPKTSTNEPDGKWELVQAKFMQLVNGSQIRNQQDAINLVEKAYVAVNESLNRLIPKPANRRALSSTRASLIATPEPKSLDDVAAIFMSGGKYTG
jgi:hypothetical protein